MTVRGAGGRVEQLRLFPLPPPLWASLVPAASGLLAGGETPERGRRRAVHGPTAAAGGQRRVEEVERVLAMYVPGSLRGEAPAVVVEVMRAARVWVAAAGPVDGAAVRQWMWAVAPFLAWLGRELGSLDAAMVNGRNVGVWIDSVNKHQTPGWRHQAQACLRRVGRVVNPDGGWPPRSRIGRNPIALPYVPEIEAVFQRVVELPRPGDQAGRGWVAAGGFGSGLSGVDLLAAETGDLHDLGNGRLGVRVRGRNPRLVPVRACWTETVLRAAALARGRQGRNSARFVLASDKNAVSRLAANLDFGQGGLSLRRARATWIAAHLLAGTSFPALRALAGGLSAQTVVELTGLMGDEIDPERAVIEGLWA